MRRTLAMVLMGLMVPLTACGDDDPTADPTTGPTSGATSGSSSAPTDSGSADTGSPSPESSDASPSVAPADGELVDLKGFTAHAPQGWELFDKTEADTSFTKDDGTLYFFDFPGVGANDTDELAANALDDYKGDKVQPQRGEDRVVAGVPGYVLTGRIEGQKFFYKWGAVNNGRFVTLEVAYTSGAPDAMAVVDAILASWQWK